MANSNNREITLQNNIGDGVTVPNGPIAAESNDSKVRKSSKSERRKTDTTYLRYDQQITMADGKQHTLETLRPALIEADNNKLSCQCPFCDDPDAVVQLTATHFIQLSCKRCASTGKQKEYLEDPIEPGMFMLEEKVVRVQKNQNNAYVVKVSDDYFNDDDKKYAKTYLCRARCIPTADLKVENHASVEYPAVDYHLDIPAGLLTVEIPTAIQVDKEDNDFINRWIKQMFGDYANFIKDWMALYCYTNYQALPVLVLKGPRGCGKTTFGEVMAEIFPDFSDSWSAESSNFNSPLKKKLLLIEENDGNKKEQYVQLKQTTGAAYLTINEKYVPHYKVRNNIKVIITTNEARPMFLVPDEKPTSPDNNNFFIYQVPPVTQINPRIKKEILERLGWYMRTELRKRYEEWKVRQIESACRYGIPCPITQLELDLYGSAMTGIDVEVELLKNQLLSGAALTLVHDNHYAELEGNGYKARKDDKDGKYYVRMEDIKGIVKALDLRSGKLSDYTKRLMDKGIISYDQKRRNNGRMGHQILVPMDNEVKQTKDDDVIFQ